MPRSHRSYGKQELRQELGRAESGKAFIDHWLGRAATEIRSGRRGCLLVNTAGEFAQADKRIAALVSESFAEINKIVWTAIRRAQSEGDIPANKDAKALATYLVSSMSGLQTKVKSGADRQAVQGVASMVQGALA